MPVHRMQNSKNIRRAIRAKRRALSRQEQHNHSVSAANHFIINIRLLRSRRIALYLAADGELDPRPLIQRLRKLDKTLYLPVLKPGSSNALWFSEFHPNDRLQPNRFGIAEPNIRHRKPVPAWSLDLIIMPLVAFSSDGGRLGMGGGYYDRTLAYQLQHNQWIRPALIGFAHDFQRVERLSRQPWDVPLHGVITEQGYQVCRSLKRTIR